MKYIVDFKSDSTCDSSRLGEELNLRLGALHVAGSTHEAVHGRMHLQHHAVEVLRRELHGGASELLKAIGIFLEASHTIRYINIII